MNLAALEPAALSPDLAPAAAPAAASRAAADRADGPPAGIGAGEWRQRVDLAACYRLVALYGWDDLIFTHISARVPGPRAPLPDQSLRLDVPRDHGVQPGQGRPRRQQGRRRARTTINPAGFTIHSAIHAAREDAECVLHVHTRQRGGRVGAGRKACCRCRRTRCSYWPRSATTTTKASRSNDDEKPRLVRDLGAQALHDAAQPRHADGRRARWPRPSSRCKRSSRPPA